MLALRQRSITLGHQVAADIGADVGTGIAGGFAVRAHVFVGISLKRMRVGTATPGPKVNTSRAPSDGMNDSRFSAASETAERISAWSCSFDRRMQNSVQHWEMMVGSISAGRCVTSPRKTPYLRPSLAMRESARRVGPKPIFLSAGA